MMLKSDEPPARLVVPHRDRGIPRKSVFLKNNRTTGTTRVMLVGQDIKVAVPIEAHARIGDLQIGNSRVGGVRIEQDETHVLVNEAPGLTTIDRIVPLEKDLRRRSRDIRRIVVHPNRYDFLRIKRIHCDDRTVLLRT